MVDTRVIYKWFQKCLLVFLVQFLVVAAQTNNQDLTILQILKNQWGHTPPNWVGSDPCGGKWEGIGCANSRVISITLASLGVTGQLPADIVNLSELQILDLSYNTGLTGSLPPSIGNLKQLTSLSLVGCGFTGPIPDSIGSLSQLTYLSLNSNGFSGGIPASIGSLLNLYWLDLSENKLTGTIPVSTANTPGLDLLVNTKHFHFGMNQLSGNIPSKLFNPNLTLIHVLFDSNQLTGTIPSGLGLVTSLEVVRLDRNLLSGSVPSNINNLVNINELFLSNNGLTGPLPDLTGMSFLNYVDMSNNTFNVSAVPSWFSTLTSLTTLVMQNTGLKGSIPTAIFSPPQLQTVILSNNQLNGTLNLGSSYSNQLQLVDLQNNFIDAFTQGNGYDNSLVLVGNPICQESRSNQNYCTIPVAPNSSYSTPNNCAPTQCSTNQISSPNCKCAYPYMGTLFFRAPSFSDLKNSTIYTTLQASLMSAFQSSALPVDSISLSNPTKNLQDYLVINLEIFPSSGIDNFNRTGISGIGFVLSNQTYKAPDAFGPYYFIGQNYLYFSGASSGSSSSNTGVIAGAAAGGAALLLLLIFAGLYAYRQKRRAERADKQNNPFALWDTNNTSGGIPQLKGARNFSFEELKKCTNNFSEANNIGAGGYGMVYRGTLSNGLLVAIKRAQQGSTQGAFEFKTEIELLSRVHHKNVVSLVGFCFDQAEQMLVYEFIPNGTVKDSLSGKSGIKMDWMRRLRIALGAARGLQYLHDLANPPIIHRDIKSNNILLDERLNAKVADFGLSKLMSESEKGHVTTQVKGTMGYLDPEYYMTQQLTEKSDVYSFGVVLLELITARNPIEKGIYIVRRIKEAMDKTQDLYNLQAVLDPIIGSGNELKGLERFVDLALSCVKEAGVDRPSMSDVVKEIENIMELAGLNPNSESAPTSESYVGISKGLDPYTNESLFTYSGTHLPATLEPK